MGGAFTDVLFSDGGSLGFLKVPSNARNPEESVIRVCSRAGVRRAELVHCSTIATNAVLERKGARTAFVSTKGFRDLTEIGRLERTHLCKIPVRKPEPLVPRDMKFEAHERVTARGRVHKRLSVREAERLCRAVVGKVAESVAVCLLFSFENPRQERKIARAFDKSEIDCSISSAVLPEYREHERASTTVVNAYLVPVLDRYPAALERLLESEEYAVSLRLMHSFGGTISPTMDRRRLVDLVFSGPAGGFLAAEWLSKKIGLERVISLDMGEPRLTSR